MGNNFSAESIEQEIKEPKLKFVRPELLLHPTVPDPLHSLSPRTLMTSKNWNITRRSSYSYNNYHCYACGKYAEYDEKNQRFVRLKLHAHECYKYDYMLFTAELVEIVALCPLCHEGIHIRRSQALYDKGILDEESMWLIYTNRDNVLNLNDEHWSKWCLAYDGKLHYSNFKDRGEWEEKYNV